MKTSKFIGTLKRFSLKAPLGFDVDRLFDYLYMRDTLGDTTMVLTKDETKQLIKHLQQFVKENKNDSAE